VQFENQGVPGADIIHEIGTDLAAPGEETGAKGP
jgi:hypothetical protein